MNKATLKLISVLFGMSILLTGCMNSDNQELVNIQNELEVQQVENEKLTEENEALKSQIKELEEELERIKSDEIADVLKVYTLDVNTSEEVVIDVLETQEYSIQDNLNRLSENLSENVFEGLPIIVEDIKEIEGNQVVYVSLREDNELEVSWRNDFLQGSMAAMLTEKSIVDTFLQEEYKGEWIDGIHIQYEDGTMEFDHAPLIGQVIYRNN